MGNTFNNNTSSLGESRFSIVVVAEFVDNSCLDLNVPNSCFDCSGC